jgi:hypothetical protein
MGAAAMLATKAVPMAVVTRDFFDMGFSPG